MHTQLPRPTPAPVQSLTEALDLSQLPVEPSHIHIPRPSRLRALAPLREEPAPALEEAAA